MRIFPGNAVNFIFCYIFFFFRLCHVSETEILGTLRFKG